MDDTSIGTSLQWGASKTYWWPSDVESHPINKIDAQSPLCATDSDFDADYISVKSISTYPVFSDGRRDGDPIADKCTVKVFKNAAYFGLADGCGWGPRSLAAATSAVAGFRDTVEKYLDEISDVQESARVLLRAFAAGHNKIMEGKKETWECGSTTLLGALLLSCPKDSPYQGDAPYVFVCVNVGDCKAFVVNKNGQQRNATIVKQPAANQKIANTTSKTESNEMSQEDVKQDSENSKQIMSVVDVTHLSKNGIRDRCDPGGRIGPYLDGKADVRNLIVCTCPVYPGDLICIVSDGVHDNLDPEQLGLPLKDFADQHGQILVNGKKVMIKDFVPVASSSSEDPKQNDARKSKKKRKETKTETSDGINENKTDSNTSVISTNSEEVETIVGDNKDWEKLSSFEEEVLKVSYREKLILGMVQNGHSTPSSLSDALINHCIETTSKSRRYMEENPANTHPPDYVEYPGKMDHTTCIVYLVPDSANDKSSKVRSSSKNSEPSELDPQQNVVEKPASPPRRARKSKRSENGDGKSRSSPRSQPEN